MEDQAATLAAASEWGAEQTMSDMEALMWRSEASPRLRSGGVILDVLIPAPDGREVCRAIRALGECGAERRGIHGRRGPAVIPRDLDLEHLVGLAQLP